MEKFEDNVAENEDDPEVYASSSDEWDEAVVAKKKGGKAAAATARRTPARGKKAKAKAPVESSESEDDDDEEDDEEEQPKSKSINGVKRAKMDNTESAKKRTGGGGGKDNSDFVNGGFLILKKDAQEGESKQPILWRIDGKVLLQKYEAFEEDGQVRHRNTNIYTAWSNSDKDLYYPVTVKVLQHQGQNMTVELNWEKLKELCAESE